MDYEDAITIRLSGEDSRDALFDSDALEQIAAAMYDTERLQVDGPYRSAFDSLDFGVVLPRTIVIDGSWQALGGADRRDVRLSFPGFGADGAIRVNAIWRGRIVARSVPASGRIVDAASARLDLNDLDADINPLPADPVALEAARRVQVIARLRAILHAPDVADDELVERWLDAANVGSVSDLLSGAARSVQTEAVQVTFSPPDGGPPVPTTLPIVAALMARDAGFGLTALLADSKVVRDQMIALGMTPPRSEALPRRQDAVPIWIVPAAVFDDDAWPGAAQGMGAADRRAARRKVAGQWLAREGIGLAVVS